MRRDHRALVLASLLPACVSTVGGSSSHHDVVEAATDHADNPQDAPAIDASVARDALDVTPWTDLPPLVRDGYFVDRPPCTGEACLRAIDLQLGFGAALVRLADGSYRGWGDNIYGAFRTRNPMVFSTPRALDFEDFLSARLGSSAVFALDRMGRIAMWGYGVGAPVTIRHVSLPVSEIIDVGILLALSSDRQVVQYGILEGSIPRILALPRDITTLPDGPTNTCVGGPSGVWCWGDDSRGQLGDDAYPRTAHTPVRALIPDGPFLEVRQVTGGGNTRCALIRRNLQVETEVWCWGGNVHLLTEVDAAGTTFWPVPVHVDALRGARNLATNGLVLCAVMADGTVRCAGDNYFGGIGNGRSSGAEPWTTVPELRDVAQLAAASGVFCARTQGGEVWCWGDGNNLVLHFASTALGQIHPPFRIRWQ